ncbi:MAG TPA: hypothetical protein VH740_18105 [Vicinamibacterales bacterium]|jgi:hypothetical protein
MDNHLRRPRTVLASSAAALLLLLSAQPAGAQSFSGAAAWSSAGATGIADESSTSIVAFDNAGGVGIKLTAPAGSVAVLRFPVSFLPSLWNTGPLLELDHLKLTMTFRKPDDASYASATLKRVRVSDGAVSSMASVNTFGFLPAAAAQQSERAINCGEDVVCINPYEYAFYVELVLWKPETTSDPRVVALRIHTSTN